MKAFLIRNKLAAVILTVGSVFILLQKPEFVTTSTLKLSSIEDAPLITMPLLPNAGTDDNNLIEEIASSKGFSKTLMENTNLYEHYLETSVIRRGLSSYNNLDEFHGFISNYISASYNEDKNITELKVNAFDPETSHKAIETIITSIVFEIARINRDKVSSQLAPTIEQIETQKKEVTLQQAKLQGFEDAHNLANPDKLLEGNILALVEAQKKIHVREAEIQKLLTFHNPASTEVILAKQQLQVLKQAVHNIGKQTLEDDRVRTLMIKHENLLMDYKASALSLQQLKGKLQQLKQDLTRKQKHISLITRPIKAETPEEPNRLKLFIILFIIVFFTSAIEFSGSRFKWNK